MLYVKYEKNRLHGFRGDVVWKCWQTTDDGRTDGRRIPSYTISSPMSLRLRWAKKSNGVKARVDQRPNGFKVWIDQYTNGVVVRNDQCLNAFVVRVEQTFSQQQRRVENYFGFMFVLLDPIAHLRPFWEQTHIFTGGSWSAFGKELHVQCLSLKAGIINGTCEKVNVLFCLSVFFLYSITIGIIGWFRHYLNILLYGEKRYLKVYFW